MITTKLSNGVNELMLMEPCFYTASGACRWSGWYGEHQAKYTYRMGSKKAFVKIQDRLYKYRYKYSVVRGPWWSSMKCNKAAINCNAFIGKRYFKECENNCNELIFTMMLNQLV